MIFFSLLTNKLLKWNIKQNLKWAKFRFPQSKFFSPFKVDFIILVGGIDYSFIYFDLNFYSNNCTMNWTKSNESHSQWTIFVLVLLFSRLAIFIDRHFEPLWYIAITCEVSCMLFKFYHLQLPFKCVLHNRCMPFQVKSWFKKPIPKKGMKKVGKLTSMNLCTSVTKIFHMGIKFNVSYLNER